MMKMLRMFLALDNNIKLTQLTSDLESSQRELGLLANISLPKLLDQLMLLRKLRKKNLMIMKSLTAQLTTATHKWPMVTAPTFQLQWLPQILQLNQSIAPQSKLEKHQSFNLMTCSSLAVTGKVQWLKIPNKNSTTKKLVSLTLTQRELKRWPRKTTSSAVILESNQHLMLMQLWKSLDLLLIQRETHLPRSFSLKDQRKWSQDQRKLKLIPKNQWIKRKTFTMLAFHHWADKLANQSTSVAICKNKYE